MAAGADSIGNQSDFGFHVSAFGILIIFPLKRGRGFIFKPLLNARSDERVILDDRCVSCTFFTPNDNLVAFYVGNG
jgi:hypothetical protein